MKGWSFLFGIRVGTACMAAAQPVQDMAVLDLAAQMAKQTLCTQLQLLYAASVVALSTSAAGRAAAETVMPFGSGVPVVGGAGGSGGSGISVDAAVNQLVDAIKVCRVVWLQLSASGEHAAG